ncbi:FAD-binding protein [Sporichthya polymorpha]|uniref:FAD-binding protein n=1 Tax=Sporichthya polymorpha TaxID=35751 RepID=UPI000A0638C1|nr:FAD-binding protein [Sporichthya polymorpha]
MNEVRGWGGLGALPAWDYALIAERMGRDARTWGEGVMGYLLKAALVDRRIPVLLDTRADRLIMEGGAVVGVEAETGSGERIAVRGRAGVLLATGGYG